jgi:hypothetical protein
MALTPPASNNSGPLTEADYTAITTAGDPLGATAVGARLSGGDQAANAAGGVDWAGNFVTTAYDLVVDNAWRENLIFDPMATKMPTRLTHAGSVVSFPVTDDLPEDVASAVLDEDYDVLPTKFASAHQSVTMKEYGRVVTRTNLVRGMSMVPFDPIAAEKVARNAVGTIDAVALAALIDEGTAGDQGITTIPGATFGTEQASMPTVAAGTTPTATLIDIATEFETNNVAPFANGLYCGILTPADAALLRKEADAGGWRYFQVNQQPGGGTGDIPRRSIGAYEGFMFFVSNRLAAAFGGQSVFLGQDALAKAFPSAAGFGPRPTVEVAPVVDRLRRFSTVGWLWTGGYRRYRHESAISSTFATP